MYALDIETYDPNLEELGDGSCRMDGRILCCGCHGNGISKVFDFDEPNEVEELRDILKSNEPKVFHNGIYDLSWLVCGYGFEVNGILHDTMTRAALIDEREPLGLDACCKRMGLKGKNKSDTIDVWFEHWQTQMKLIAKGVKKYGITADNEVFCPDGQVYRITGTELECVIDGTYKKNVWANALNIWADPTGRELMKKYNLQDCIATYNLFIAQEPFMKNLQRVYDLECRLLPILLKMKKTGIRFDVKRAEELAEKVDAERKRVENKLIETYGITGSMIDSSKQLGARLNEMDIYSPVKTATGAQSWAADAICRIHHPVVPLILEYKNYDGILNKFLRGALAKSVTDAGRIHCTFYPMLREKGGTVTGRFSCQNPNLQQIPARDKGHGTDFSQDMRSLFLPEEGMMLAADDYSQIEALLLGHFAQGPQAEWFREQLRAGVDMHKIAMGMTGITYRPVVKTFNYGCIYGMGWETAMVKNYNLFEKLASEEGKDVETFTKEIYYNYHAKFPLIKDTIKWAANIAKVQGYIDTMGGRRQHKPKPEYDPKTGKIQDFLYKMLNKLIQGTAADILKQALINAWDEGIYDVLTLHLLVHDEQVNSVPFNKIGTEAAVRLQEIMAEVYRDQLSVPIKAECELGPNWGYWSGDIYEQMKTGNFDPAFFNKDYKETH